MAGRSHGAGDTGTPRRGTHHFVAGGLVLEGRNGNVGDGHEASLLSVHSLVRCDEIRDGCSHFDRDWGMPDLIGFPPSISGGAVGTNLIYAEKGVVSPAYYVTYKVKVMSKL